MQISYFSRYLASMKLQMPMLCAIRKNEPPHDKTNKMTVHLAKTQISLGICPVWSESSLCTQWVAKDPSFLHANSEYWLHWVDAQADLSLCWAHNHFVGFVMSRLITNVFSALCTSSYCMFYFSVNPLGIFSGYIIWLISIITYYSHITALAINTFYKCRRNFS